MIKNTCTRVEEVFGRALDFTEASSRDRYLGEACGKNQKLRNRVEKLLLAHSDAAGFLDESQFSSGEDSSVLEEPGTQLGPYVIEELMGEGGFGSVYRAHQTLPVRREVALKIIKLGMDTRSVIARFEAERQALAMMDHPGIARVLDAGATASGRPYFVMELVDGVPITDYCDRNQLGLRERLELFSAVCRGVEHAHQKGIIHRDLKPSNVLVTRNDGKAAPKIIDFGIAKATRSRLTEKTLLTGSHVLMGTPDYMSPEQLACSGIDVDTRSDVYSLGILLYELLTGVTPFGGKGGSKLAIEERKRRVQVEEPTKPSVVWMRTDQVCVEEARNRRGKPLELSREIRGDLDWVVLKALDKDRNRRYETASFLALDLERYLAHEPVLATPPSRLYLCRKFVRRHRVGVIAGVVMAVGLFAGLTLSLLGFIGMKRSQEEATRQAQFARIAEEGERSEKAKAQLARDEAERLRALAEENARRAQDQKRLAEVNLKRAQELQEMAQAHARTAKEQSLLAEMNAKRASDAQNQADALRRLAEKESAKSEAITAFLTEMLASQDPKLPKKEISVSNVLDEAARRLSGSGIDSEPLVEAGVREAIGKTYQSIGRVDEAEAHMRSSLNLRRETLGKSHPETLLAMIGLGRILLQKGNLEEARGVAEEALELQLKLMGPEHQDVATSAVLVGQIAIQMGDLQKGEVLVTRGYLLQLQLLGEEHPKTLQSLVQLAQISRMKGDFARSLELAQQSLALARKVHGDEHQSTITALHSLATVLMAMGEVEQAGALCREAYEMSSRLLGREHPRTAVSLQMLGEVSAKAGRYKEAEQLYREALKAMERVLGPDHPQSTKVSKELAKVLTELGR